MYKNWIDGQWADATAASNINLSDTRDIIGEYAQATAVDAADAVAAAHAAASRETQVISLTIMRKLSSLTDVSGAEV